VIGLEKICNLKSREWVQRNLKRKEARRESKWMRKGKERKEKS
jgi:hypothetical protein